MPLLKIENAIVVTADQDFKRFVEEGKIDVPVCSIKIDQDAKTAQLIPLNVSDDDRAWFVEIDKRARQKGLNSSLFFRSLKV